ncbi:efflux RND transporter periplasmic adaptor subunit [Clostridium lacusfryxellense]|uniref:efflux RND transporter periplasmic adaptor subunit n=1 Tax=Clostridium lacusfryxellense TaxID=205328 RepID=UPI001C0E60DD|nr:efflux RND transporter periplasmic adaptor subunit [Clostridium lacusfryxellense]MBU3112369.1 efflux RND transporter periplasmic adaptor subunit [Clostridium lacusfryxellense]
MKKKHIIFISIIVLIILVGIIAFVFKNNKTSTSNKSGQVAVYKIPAKDKIFVNGIIVPEKIENIYRDETKGSINKVSVTDGQLVKKGDALFTYKNELITEQIDQANQLITTSNKQKKKLLNKQSEAKKLLAKQKQEAKQQVAKQQQAATLAGAPSASVDSNSIVASLTANTEALISSYPDQIDTVQTQIDTSNDQVKKLKVKEFNYIKAPIAGKIILNDTNDMTKAYITIEATTFYVKGSINEKDQTKLKENQQVDILIFATNRTLTGKVKSVGKSPAAADVAAQATTGGAAISYYDANVALDSQENIVNGFHVQATVRLEGEDMKIPKSSLLEEAGKQYVFKVVNKKLTKLAITTKKSTDSEVIVLSGLKENDSIAKTSKDMKEGISVE